MFIKIELMITLGLTFCGVGCLSDEWEESEFNAFFKRILITILLLCRYFWVWLCRMVKSKREVLWMGCKSSSSILKLLQTIVITGERWKTAMPQGMMAGLNPKLVCRVHDKRTGGQYKFLLFSVALPLKWMHIYGNKIYTRDGWWYLSWISDILLLDKALI